MSIDAAIMLAWCVGVVVWYLHHVSVDSTRERQEFMKEYMKGVIK